MELVSSYQKFIRAKDVSKYSSKDLESILGKKALSGKTEVNMEKDNSICKNEAIGTKDNWGGVVTINSGSMADYFKQKLPNCKKNLSNNTIDNQAIDSKSETRQCFGFGFIQKTENTLSTDTIAKNSSKKSNYAYTNPCLELISPMETTLNIEDSSKKSKKKRRKEFVQQSADLYVDETNKVSDKKSKNVIIDSNCKDGYTNPALNLNTKPNEDYNGKEYEVSRAQFGLENCGLDLTDEKSNKKRVTFNDHVEYSIDVTRRKKEKVTLDKFEVENKKLKKKRKHGNIATPSTGFINEALDVEILSAEINDNELNEHKSTKIKKRKICKTSNLETIQESPEREKEIIEISMKDDTLDTSSAEYEKTNTAVKKSEKKKKKKKVKIVDDNIADMESKEPNIIDKVFKHKKHKLDYKKVEILTHEMPSKKKKTNNELKIMSNGISEKLETKQQPTDHLVKSKNTKSRKEEIIIDSAEVVTPPVVMPIMEESVPLERKNIVQKKRNKDNFLESEINACDVKEEISDKENVVEEEKRELNIKLPKKGKKRKRSKDALDTGDSTSPSAEVIDADIISNKEHVDNAEFTDTPSKKKEIIDSTNSPLNKKEKMTKKMLKELFHKKLIADFPGSNLREITGYGVNDM